MTGKRTFTKEEKLRILKEVEQEGVKATLEKHGIYPATYYSWKKKFEQMGEAGFQHGMTPVHIKEIKRLEKEINNKLWNDKPNKKKHKVDEKGYRNKPLTDKQKASNRKKSKTRVRVEHVFSFMGQSMNGLMVKSVGITRPTGIIGLISLTYNLFRYEQIVHLNILPVK